MPRARPFAEELDAAEVVRGTEVHRLHRIGAARVVVVGDGAVAVGRGQLQWTARVAEAPADVAAYAGRRDRAGVARTCGGMHARRRRGAGCEAVALVQRVLQLPVKAAEVRRQKVADGIACAHVVRIAREGGVGREDQVAAGAVGVDRVEQRVVPEGRREVAAEADLTEAARKAHGRAAREVRDAHGAVVVGDWGLEPEAGSEAAAEVFGAAKAQAAGAVAGVAEGGAAHGHGGREAARVRRAGRIAADHRIDHTEDGDRGLGRCGTGHGDGSQCNQGFVHRVESRKWEGAGRAAPRQPGSGLHGGVQ
ncbi:hypothetical protein D3C71_1132230 [compost metagenome]